MLKVCGSAVDLTVVRIGFVVRALGVLNSLGSKSRRIKIVQLDASPVVSNILQIKPILGIICQVHILLTAPLPVLTILLKQNPAILL